MDPALTAEALEEVFGQPATAFSGVAGCSVGLLGAMSVVTFQASMPPLSGWTTPPAADVEKTLAFLAKELPGLHVDSRKAAYDVLGERRKEDAELNITIELVLRRRVTREYLLIRTYAG
jgi:hypothetical protein